MKVVLTILPLSQGVHLYPAAQKIVLGSIVGFARQVTAKIGARGEARETLCALVEAGERTRAHAASTPRLLG